MAWYDWFALTYDRSLEALYRDDRETAADALDIQASSVILDVPCGTGQSFPALSARIGARGVGRVLGVDLSEGMLGYARARVARGGLDNVVVHRADATTLSDEALAAALGRPAVVDRVHVFLGMSVFPDPAQVFAGLWARLAPGGRLVMVDTYAARPSLQGHLVNFMAGADVRRRSWEHLEAVGDGFERRTLSTRWEHGGELWLATATKPRS